MPEQSFFSNQLNYSKTEPPSKNLPFFDESTSDETVSDDDRPSVSENELTNRIFVFIEHPEGQEERIKLQDWKDQFPIMELRAGKTDTLNREALFINVEGNYFPDYFTEQGLHFFSLPFWEYLKNTISINPKTAYRRIGFVAEKGKRVEEYFLVIPETADCLLTETVRFDQSGWIEYFEIDPARVGNYGLLRIKGFPHFITTKKLDTLSFAGFDCVPIENFFAYNEEQRRIYLERAGGKWRAEALKGWEQATRNNQQYLRFYELHRNLNPEKLRPEITAGFKNIFDSYNGQPINGGYFTKQKLTFKLLTDEGKIELTPDSRAYFQQSNFTLPSLANWLTKTETLPEGLKSVANSLARELLLSCLITAVACFERYPAIHRNRRFRIYCQVSDSNSRYPALIYEYQSEFQHLTAKTADLRTLKLSGRDLREYDFINKDLHGMVIVDSDLRRAKFVGCNLTAIKFQNCNLSEVTFEGCRMREAGFAQCSLSQTRFSKTDLRGGEFTHCDFNDSYWVRCDLSAVKIFNEDLTQASFYRCRLFDAIIEISGSLHQNAFRLCDLRGAQFNGDNNLSGSTTTYCDFRNSDLTGCRFQLTRIGFINFTKARLTNVAFECYTIHNVNFRWSVCQGLALSPEAFDCDFSFVDLSLMRIMKGTLFGGCNFYYTNLSRYDFSASEDSQFNNFEYTDLSNCSLRGFNLVSSNLTYPDFNGAYLNGAVLSKSQLKYIKLSEGQQKSITIVD